MSNSLSALSSFSSSLQLILLFPSSSFLPSTSRIHQILPYHLRLILPNLHSFTTEKDARLFLSTFRPLDFSKSLFQSTFMHLWKFSSSHLLSNPRLLLSQSVLAMADQIALAISHKNIGVDDPSRMLSEATLNYSVHQAQNSLIPQNLHHSQQADKLRNSSVDLWKFQKYMIWVCVLNIPADFRYYVVLMEFGNCVGSLDNSKLRQSPWSNSNECLVRVRKNTKDKLKFAQQRTEATLPSRQRKRKIQDASSSSVSRLLRRKIIYDGQASNSNDKGMVDSLRPPTQP